MPIAQSPIRLIVVKSSTPSPTRHLSCGAWASAKSVGDCQRNLHVLLGDVRNTIFVVIASAITNVDCRTVQTCWCCFPQWWHKCLWPTYFFAIAVAVRPVLLQVLWCSMAMTSGCDWHDQFYGGHIGTFTIIKGCGPVTLCGKGLIVALHDVCGQSPLWQEAHCCLLWHTQPMLLWWGAHCCTQPSCHPWQGFVIAFFGEGLIVALLDKCGLLGILWHLWHTCNTCLSRRTCLFQRTRRTQLWRICAAYSRVA